ncbi:MAG: transcription-repair coupling factor [Thermosulfidibacteraceae bacterium]
MTKRTLSKKLYIPDSALSYYLGRLILEGKSLLVISPKDEIDELFREMLTFSRKVGLLLGDNSSLRNSIKTLEIIEKSKHFAILSTIEGLYNGVGSVDELTKKAIKLTIGEDINKSVLVEKLIDIGYVNTGIVDNPGTIATRGFVIDIFPINHDYPVRIELDENTIESIRIFEPESQRSIKEIESIKIYPLKVENKIDIVMLNFDEIIKINPEALYEELESIKFYKDNEIKYIEETLIIDTILHGGEEKSFNIILKPFNDEPRRGRSIDKWIEMIREFNKKGYTTFIVCENDLEVDTLSKILNERNFYFKITEFKRGLPKNSTYILKGYLRNSFLWEEDRVIFIKFDEILGKVKKIKKVTKPKRLHQLFDLEVGDYVVHREHGIGIFQGTKKIEVEGNIIEFITIEYAGGDILYVPLDKLHYVEKYISKEGAKPPLDRLGGKSWETRKRKVKKAVEEIAEKLLMIEARRKAQKGHSFSPDTPWQVEFEEAFPYEETPDQLKAIEDVKRDMELPTPMDRLICGDVGFGKTEIAMRAAFKAVMDGKQVAVLTPTTILAHQHYTTFKERFAGFPVNIEVLTRFVSKKDQSRIIEEVKSGKVDILIGTHRILMDDVEFKDLGLLIIDEEHKFGVEHKEKIKEKHPTIDILTMSATPIPRTLNMALSGIKDISVIETPPEGRQSIKTFVMYYNEEIVKRAIERELKRKGKVFVVKSRIEGIEKVMEKISKLCPNAKCAIVHGKMKGSEIEERMLKFTRGDIDVLISTQIVESGLDIPTANTLIVIDSEKFGLAQLYQLRGRVGRNRDIAYAYFLVTPKKITEDVKRRLRALEEFSELGSGLRLALRDMEIRGFGNLLGKEQSGHITSVGLEEYLRLLEEAVRKLKGEPVEDFEPTIKLTIPAFLPDSYIGNEKLKIKIYRTLVNLDLNELENVKQELEDRFGKLPREGENFIELLKLRLLAKNLKIPKIYQKGSKIFLNTSERIAELLIKEGFKKEKDTVYTEKDIETIVKVLSNINKKLEKR